jgi:hypothetical protein
LIATAGVMASSSSISSTEKPPGRLVATDRSFIVPSEKGMLNAT